jgi:tetratricopeptide (TPR) repeat protein
MQTRKESRMLLTQNWFDALERAQTGDLSAARAARAAEPPDAMADYFFGRCLAEAPAVEPDQYLEAIDHLKPAVEAESLNPLYLQTLILALARVESPDALRQAAGLWRRYGLPHDLDLLAQVALTLEMQLRSQPADPAVAALPWPELLPKPDHSGDQVPAASPAVAPEGVILSPPVVPSSPADATPAAEPAPELPAPVLRTLQRLPAPSSRTVQQMVKLLERHEMVRVIEMAGKLLAEGRENAELHLLAGMAAEEGADSPRARAHLARSLRLEPDLLLARMELGRVYWRLNKLDLAMALWRSLPVEGPSDYGRHYHLALGHEALGDRRAALAAMRICLRDFFDDARHFYVKRALERWLGVHP